MKFQILKQGFIINQCFQPFQKKWERQSVLKHLRCYKKLCLLILSKKRIYVNKFKILKTKWFKAFKKLIKWELNFKNYLTRKVRTQSQLWQKFSNLNSKKQRQKNLRFNLKNSNRNTQTYSAEETTFEKNGAKLQSFRQGLKC